MAQRDLLKLENRREVGRAQSSSVSTVHPKPHAAAAAQSELSREVRIALDGLAARGLTSPKRSKHANAAGMAPFICG